MQTPEGLRRLLGVWSHRNYACFMGGMTPALLTLWMQRIGTLWLAWELTRSNTWVGLIVAADYAPMLVLAPFVGAYIEKSNPVRMQIRAQTVSLSIAATLAALSFAGVMSIWILLALSLALGCVHPFSAISRHTIVPSTVPKAELPTALATDSALYNAARFVGPAVAGYVIAFSGVGLTFTANVAGILCYIVGLSLIRVDYSERTSVARTGLLGDIAEGLRYVRHHPGIGPLLGLMIIGSIWVRPLGDLLPGFADKVFAAGPQGLGWLTAGMGLGAAVGAVLIAMYARTQGLTLSVLLAFLANVAATALFAASSWLWLAIPLGAIWGATLTILSTGTQALVQSSVDNAIRARVMSIYTMIYRGAPFLGAIVIGWSADRIGLQAAFMLATLVCLVPWVRAFARRGELTVALEGRGNDLDARLLDASGRMLSASKAWAGNSYGRMRELGRRAGPAAARARDQSKALVTRARAWRPRREPGP